MSLINYHDSNFIRINIEERKAEIVMLNIKKPSPTEEE